MAQITPITMPKFGLSMTEGQVASWSVPEGGFVTTGQELADIETTKITNAYELPVTGVLRRHIAAEQEMLPVGALIGIVADESVPDGDIDAFVTKFRSEFVPPESGEDGNTGPAPQKMTVGGQTIRYLAMGDGELIPVVFVHGFGGDLNSWMFNQPVIAENRKTYAVDLPGHGESSKNVGGGDIANLADAVAGLLAALDIDKPHLVGHSLGGAVVLHIALHHPDRVASLSLVAPGSIGEEINTAFVDGLITAERRKQLQPVLELLFADPALVSRDMIDNFLKFKRLDGAVTALSTIAAANFRDGRQSELLVGRIATIDTPIQVIWGAKDQVIPAKHAEMLPLKVATHILAGAGHMPHMEAAAEVNRLLTAFFKD